MTEREMELEKFKNMDRSSLLKFFRSQSAYYTYINISMAGVFTSPISTMFSGLESATSSEPDTDPS